MPNNSMFAERLLERLLLYDVISDRRLTVGDEPITAGVLAFRLRCGPSRPSVQTQTDDGGHSLKLAPGQNGTADSSSSAGDHLFP